MAKDDYFVVMYRLLKILYSNLKQGKQISDREFAELQGTLNQRYWEYILSNLMNDGYITGITPIRTLSGDTIKCHDVMITPLGIEYLFSNSMMERVKNTLKDIKDTIPGF